jgi:gluconolactonase
VSGEKVFAVIDKGVPDGIRCDAGGRVWSSSGDGVQVFSPKGELIARILLPESAANVAFGGPTGKTLFMTARTSVYSVETSVRGARRPGAK